LSYIGRTPVVGNFVKLDAIVTSATATYNLLNGGVAYFPQTANNCIVSLNGVIQSPTSAYTISGSTIVFDSALTSADTIDFILVLGDVLAIGTPSDATVGFAKVTSNLITGATAETSIAGGDSVLIYDDSASALRKMTRTNFISGLNNAPAFMAFQDNSTTQSISNATWTEVTIYDTELFDTDSAFDTSNCRFTPQVAGKYFFTAQIYIQGGAAAGFNAIIIAKNGGISGASTNELFWQSTLAVGVNDFRIQGILTMNGTSDYVSVFINQQTGGSKTIGGSSVQSAMFFGGYRLIGV